MNKNLRIVNEQKTDTAIEKRSTPNKQANKKDKISLKTLRKFSQKQVHRIWFDLDISCLLWKKLDSKRIILTLIQRGYELGQLN